MSEAAGTHPPKALNEFVTDKMLEDLEQSWRASGQAVLDPKNGNAQLEAAAAIGATVNKFYEFVRNQHLPTDDPYIVGLAQAVIECNFISPFERAELIAAKIANLRNAWLDDTSDSIALHVPGTEGSPVLFQGTEPVVDLDIYDLRGAIYNPTVNLGRIKTFSNQVMGQSDVTNIGSGKGNLLLASFDGLVNGGIYMQKADFLSTPMHEQPYTLFPETTPLVVGSEAIDAYLTGQVPATAWQQAEAADLLTQARITL